jgi:hypothetical protein
MTFSEISIILIAGRMPAIEKKPCFRPYIRIFKAAKIAI